VPVRFGHEGRDIHAESKLGTDNGTCGGSNDELRTAKVNIMSDQTPDQTPDQTRHPGVSDRTAAAENESTLDLRSADRFYRMLLLFHDAFPSK
jgi:hypothetical protein